MKKEDTAVTALNALAHAYRLRIFRLLVRAGPEGKTAGKIAAALDIPPSSLSFHLTQLEHAGLLHSRREGRHIYYAINTQGIRELLAYLTEDCCQGQPELCAGVSFIHKSS